MWTKNSKRRIFFDMHLPDWTETNIAHNFDPVHLADTFKRSHVDSVIAYAKCQYGQFYYNTEIGHKHSGLKDSDFFSDMLKECHKRDIQVIAYYSVAWDEYMSDLHPEWLVVKADKTSDTDEFRWRTLSINSPYRDVVKEHFKEMMKKVRPDGFWIDMTVIGTDKCHCNYCNEKFKERYGYDIPKEGQDNYHVFKEFRYDYVEAFYGELRELVKSLDDSVQLCNNYWGYPYSTSGIGGRAIGSLKYADFVTGEAYTDWTGLNAPSFFSKFLRGVSLNRPYEALIGRFYNTWDYTVKPCEQLAYEAYTLAANGACVTIDDAPYHDGSIDDALYEDIGKIYSKIESREAFLGGKHKKYAGVFHSQLTKDYYGRPLEFIKSIAGAFKMLRDNHLPCDFIFDENIEETNLHDYKVIILPSVACIDDKTLVLLNDYVKRGGILICSGITGLYRVIDHKLVKDNNLLSKLMDIDFDGIGEYSLSYIKGLDLKRPSLVKGAYVKYKNYDDSYGSIVEPICETSKERFFHNNLPSPYKETDYPAIAMSHIGRGSVLAFANPIFAHYSKQSQVELRRLFKSIVTEYAGESEVLLKGPNKLDIAIWEKENKTIIHLLNPNPAMSVCIGYLDAFEGSYPRTFEYMDEVLPLYDVEVIVRGKYAKDQITLLDDIKFRVDYSYDRTHIIIEKIDLWETLVIEWSMEIVS